MNIKKQVFLNFPLGNKKAQEGGTLSVIRIAILVIIVIIVLIFLFTGWLGKEGGILSGHIDSLGDCDFDGIANLYDKCPCHTGDEKLDGCPDEATMDKYKNPQDDTKSSCRKDMEDYYKLKKENRPANGCKK